MASLSRVYLGKGARNLGRLKLNLTLAKQDLFQANLESNLRKFYSFANALKGKQTDFLNQNFEEHLNDEQL